MVWRTWPGNAHVTAGFRPEYETKKKRAKNGKVDSFDPHVFLDTAGVARKVAEFRRGESIYSQREAAESVMYVQKGGVKFSVVNGSGREEVVATFGPSDFFGEGCMAGQTVRMGTTTAITPTTLLVMEKNELLRVHIQSILYPLDMYSRICLQTHTRTRVAENLGSHPGVGICRSIMSLGSAGNGSICAQFNLAA